METPNFSYIDDLAGGDMEFRDKLLSLLKKELPGEIDLYAKTIAEKDFKRSAEAVHKIKHKITILGLEKTHSMAEKYEEELKEGNAGFHKEFLEILKNMTIFLEKIK